MFGSEKSPGVAPKERPVSFPLRLVANLSREHKGENMAEFPYMRLWTDAFIGDTGHLSAAETGAYIMLLMCAWRTPGCCLPDDDKRLARLIRTYPVRITEPILLKLKLKKIRKRYLKVSPKKMKRRHQKNRVRGCQKSGGLKTRN